MADLKFDKEITALVVIDPYNDFICDKGKIWERVKVVGEANDCVPHMLQVLTAARKAGLRVFYALHHRYRPGDYETWKYIAPIQKAAWSERRSRREPGVPRFARNSHLSQLTSWPWSIGVPVALRILIWICCLKDTAFISLWSLDFWHTHARSQRYVLPLSFATRSR